MLLRLAQRIEHCGQLHGLIHIARGHQKLSDVHAAVIRHGLEEMVQIQDADDVVYAALVHRQTRERRILNYGEDVIPIVLDVDRLNVNARGHNFKRGSLGEIYRRLNQLRLILVQHVLVLRRLDEKLIVYL